MTGYVRVDTSNNIADGNIISASDLDNEFDGVQAAFNASTGHNHDGTTGEGAPILVLGPAQDVVVGASTITPKTTNTVDIGSSSLKFKDLYLAGNASIAGALAITGATTLSAALTYGGVTLNNAVTGTGNMVLSTSPTLVTPALGTPSSVTLTNATGLPISTGVSGLGTGIATFLATPSSDNLRSAVTDETGSGALVFATSPTLVTPNLGTPSTLVGTNITGTAAGLTAGNVTTNANLTGAVTSVGNATSLGSFTSAQLAGALTDETGSGAAVFATSPTLVTPALGTPSSVTLTNATGLPISTGVSGLGTGVATALAVNVGTAGSPVINGGVLGTPSSGTLTNATGLPISTGVSGLGTGVATFLATPSSANLAAAVTDETGSGALVFATSPTLVTPALGTPSSVTLTNATGLPVATGISGLGTGIATALAVNVGSAGAPVLFNGALGTPSSGTVTNLTGTASININGTVGATTANTGAFTTLSASGAVTLSGATENGVVYANGSKVLTSGTALTFDGTTVGIGPQATSGQLVVADAITTVVAANQDRRYRAAFKQGSNFFGGEVFGGLNSGGSAHFGISVYDASSTSTVSALFQIDNTRFFTTGSEQMRLTSTGLELKGKLAAGYTDFSGIPTNGAAFAGSVGIGTSSPGYKLTVAGTSGSAVVNLLETGVRSWGIRAGGTATNTFDIADFTAGVTRLTLDSSGNLGLGVTPSGWGGTSKALQIKNYLALWQGTSGATQLGFGLYESSDNAYSYLTTGDAPTMYRQLSGIHSWFTAPSGTAGNAISFTQAMTLDASGNLGVGATSPSGRLHVAFGSASVDALFKLQQTSNGTAAGITMDANNDAGAVYNYIQSTTTGGTQHWRIDGGATASTMAFKTGGSERARIDSSGNWLVGKTVTNDTTVGAIMTPSGAITSVRADSTNSTLTYVLYSTGASAYRFYVGLGGQVYATSTSISAISDATLKENVRDLETGLTEVMALRPRRFDWKNGDAQDVAGFVAQEVEQVLPELVTDYQYSEGVTKKSLKMGDILPTLVNAIQQQQAMIQTLTDRIAALEVK